TANDRGSAFAEDRLSIHRHARNAASRMHGMNTSPARSSATPAPVTMTRGTASWTAAVPTLPPAAFQPRAAPFSRSGKKNEMFAIDDAKLPPPRPASAAAARSTGNGVVGSDTVRISAPVGSRSEERRVGKEGRSGGWG